MKLFNTVRSLVLGSFVLCSGLANAALIEFNDTSDFSFNYRVFEDVIGDIDLTVTAGIFSNNSSEITIAGPGEDDRRFGIVNDDGLGAMAFSGDDNTDIDGENKNDVLIFTFSEEVSFLSIFFGNVDRNDDFEFGLVDGDTFVRSVTDERISGDSFSLSTALVGTTFAIGAVGSNDDFTITGITAVSEPGSVLFLSLGLIGMGLRLRRSK